MTTQFLGDLSKGYLVPSMPGRTMERALHAVMNVENRVQSLQPILAENPAYEDFLLGIGFIQERINRWVSEEGPQNIRREVIVERILGLLGRGPVRNWICNVRAAQMAKKGLPRKKTDRLALNPREDLAYALLAEEYCLDNNLAHADLSYVAGLHFDWLKMIASTRKGLGDSKAYFDNLVRHGLKVGRVAYGIAGLTTLEQHEEYLFGGSILLGTGSALQSVLFPKDAGAKSWVAFLAECEKAGERAELLQDLREPNVYPLTHAELAGVYAATWKFFLPIEQALTHYREPFYLREVDRHLYRIACVFNLASHFARWTAKGAKIVPLSFAENRYLADLKLKPDAVQKVAEAVFQEKK